MVTNLIGHETLPLEEAIIIYGDLLDFEIDGLWSGGSAPKWAKDTAKVLHTSTGSEVLFVTAWEVVAKTFAKELGLPIQFGDKT